MMQSPDTPISLSKPRDTVRVTLDDGSVLEGPVGTRIEAFLKMHQKLAPERYDSTLMGAIFDTRLRELSYAVVRDADLQPVLLSSSDGGRIYRRSLVFLLTTAAAELWKACQLNVRYAVPDGGFYCMPLNRPPFSVEELAQLEAHMRAIALEDSPITKRSVPLSEALELFASRGEDDKVRLMEQRTRNELMLYTLRQRSDYYYGYMVPSAGYLHTFRLTPVDEGFILQYPRKESPTTLDEFKQDKITQVFHQADEWLQLMGVEDIGRLNRLVRNNRVHEITLVAEALHEQQIARIAHDICEAHRQRDLRIVLIAGPSSSGKTTFAKRLAIQVLAHGVRPFTIELDNYFVDRELTPRDEDGDYDFETIEAINRKLFNQQLLQLIRGDKVVLPRFDFKQGRSLEGKTVRLRENQVIVIEGIHGLNPQLVPDIPPENIYRVYVSALTPLNMDSHNRISTTDLRMLRRIVRDARTRGYTAADTINRWSSVRRGEKRNIFPYQNNADAIFNSALVYELAALRPLAEPLLLQVEPATPPHIEANRLLSFLRWVQPYTSAQEDLIPDTSLLREFIGGSNVLDYPIEELEEAEN
ncbi:MAG: nucleoside kinase [Anaerolineae bacterium]